MKFLFTVSVLFLCTCDPTSAAANSVCKDSENTDTNNDDDCTFLNACTVEQGQVPAAADGYTIECDTMPCPANQDIMFDRIEGTDTSELLPADCDNTVEACAAACEETLDCCGFNFVFNPGAYGSSDVGRCVGKKCDGRIGTSRYGMVYYKRDAGAVEGGTSLVTEACATDIDCQEGKCAHQVCHVVGEFCFSAADCKSDEYTCEENGFFGGFCRWNREHGEACDNAEWCADTSAECKDNKCEVPFPLGLVLGLLFGVSVVVLLVCILIKSCKNNQTVVSPSTTTIVQQPAMITQQQGMMVQQPGVYIQQPGMYVQQPGIYVQQTGMMAMQQQPAMMQQQPVQQQPTYGQPVQQEPAPAYGQAVQQQPAYAVPVAEPVK